MQIDLIIGMNELFGIWVVFITYGIIICLIPILLPLECFCICFCICFCVCFGLCSAFCCDCFDDFDSIIDKPMDWYFSFFAFLLEEKEPQLSSKTVKPFKSRSPLSASRHYKSPKGLVNIIEKPPSEVSNYVLI